MSSATCVPDLTFNLHLFRWMGISPRPDWDHRSTRKKGRRGRMCRRRRWRIQLRAGGGQRSGRRWWWGRLWGWWRWYREGWQEGPHSQHVQCARRERVWVRDEISFHVHTFRFLYLSLISLWPSHFNLQCVNQRIYLYSPLYRQYKAGFCVLFQPLRASVPSLLFIYHHQKSIKILWKLLYLLHAAFSLSERAEGMSVQPVIVQSMLLKQALMNTITDLLSISQQWCQRSGEVKSHTLTSNCEFLPCECILTSVSVPQTLACRAEPCHVWG